jgi:ADP-ribosylglycohydrolase
MTCAVIHGSPLRDAILTHGTNWFSKRKAELWSRDPDHIVIGRRVSPACYINEAFPASLYLAWKYANDFEAGLIANTNVGGDNCHRGTVVGALLGVATGASQIPPRFIDNLDQSPQLNTQINTLLDQLSPTTHLAA